MDRVVPIFSRHAATMMTVFPLEPPSRPPSIDDGDEGEEEEKAAAKKVKKIKIWNCCWVS